MKKFLTVIILLVALTLVGCAEKEVDGDRVTYLQTTSLYGSEGNLRLCIRSGRAESSPTADGKQGEMQGFAVMNLRVIDGSAGDNAYSYKFVIGEEEFSGEFVRDRFGSSFSANLSGDTDVSQLTAVTVICGDNEVTVPVEDMMADLIIDADKALELALSALKSDLEAEEKEGFVREIHVKFLNDGHNPSSKYYWYVAFIRADAPYWALLIDPDTGDIVAKRK